MIHGRNNKTTIFILFSCIFIFSACSGNKIKKADCYDCVTEEQKWTKFSWDKLVGTWRGNVEISADRATADKWHRESHWLEISLLDGEKFLKAYHAEACEQFPKNALVFLQPVWFKDLPKDWPPQLKEPVFEVFGQTDDNKVNYGRVYFDHINGKHICHYQSMGGKVSMNRLALPATRFTERLSPDGRLLASGETKEFEVNFEFLNFQDNAKPEKFEKKGSRVPASENKDNPPLFFRVVKITRSVNNLYSQGQWESTEEYLYRLWRVE